MDELQFGPVQARHGMEWNRVIAQSGDVWGIYIYIYYDFKLERETFLMYLFVSN